MAEAVILTVVDKLSGYLLHEDSLLYGIRNEVEWLERELRGLLCFLKDAVSKKKGNDERVKNWLRDIRNVAYEAEDVIETFIVETDNLTPVGSFKHMLIRCSPTAPFEHFLLTIGKCFPIFTIIVSHNRDGRDNIKVLKARISEISERRAELGIISLDETGGQGSSTIYESLQGRRRLPPPHDDHSVVGFEEDKRKIVELLLNDEKKLRLISITGMSGHGKTTFAKHIYDSNEVEENFDVSYWISVSQVYTVLELLHKIIEKVGKRVNTGKMDEEELKRKLHETLLPQGKYLIVMDDVCVKEVWDRIQTIFPDAMNGSRVIFTTCLIDFARSADPAITPHELSFLNHDESRELFLKNVYPNQNVEAFPDDLEVVGQNLVEKCQGLPIALVVLGGFFSIKEKNHYQWSRALKSLNWESTEDGACLGILDFCYESLPYNLKPCFLYLSSFSKDTEIPARRLMRLWMAEGFVPSKPGESRQETAEAFLEELVERSMVQVASRHWYGSVRTLRIHDILHDLCIGEAREYGFLHFGRSYVAKNQPISSDITQARRLALHAFKPESYIKRSSKKWRTPNLRTLILGSSVPELSLNGLKLLRVIDVEVENSSVALPKEIGCLVHLRYLRWRAYINYQLIKNLHYLQTLHVNFGITRVDASIGNFKDLQFLSTIKAGMWIESGLVKLTNLRKLGIDDIKDHHWQALIKSLGKLHRLVSLTLSTYYDESIPTQAISIFSCQNSLRCLKLFGQLTEKRKLPDSSAFPPNLTKLTLLFSELKADPMPTLKELPNLTCLKLLDGVYKGKHMYCQAGGFTQLRRLEIHGLHELKDWRVDNEAMPSLTHLFLSHCPNMRMLPEGLQHVTTLQELRLRQMSFEFMKRILEGEDLYKIERIPSIIY